MKFFRILSAVIAVTFPLISALLSARDDPNTREEYSQVRDIGLSASIFFSPWNLEPSVDSASDDCSVMTGGQEEERILSLVIHALEQVGMSSVVVYLPEKLRVGFVLPSDQCLNNGPVDVKHLKFASAVRSSFGSPSTRSTLMRLRSSWPRQGGKAEFKTKQDLKKNKERLEAQAQSSIGMTISTRYGVASKTQSRSSYSTTSSNVNATSGNGNDLFIFIGSIKSASFYPGSFSIGDAPKTRFDLFYCTDVEDNLLSFFSTSNYDILGPLLRGISKQFDSIIFSSPQVNDLFQKHLFAYGTKQVSTNPKPLDFLPPTMNVLRAPITHDFFLLSDGGSLKKLSLTSEQLDRRGISLIRNSSVFAIGSSSASTSSSKKQEKDFNIAVFVDNEDFCTEAINMFDNFQRGHCSQESVYPVAFKCELFLIVSRPSLCSQIKHAEASLLPAAHNVLGISATTTIVASSSPPNTKLSASSLSTSVGGKRSLKGTLDDAKVISSSGAAIYIVSHDNKAGLSVALSESTVVWVVAEKPYVKLSSIERVNTLIAEASSVGCVPLVVTSFFDKIQLGPKDGLDVEGMRVPSEILVNTHTGYWVGTAWDGVSGGVQNLVSYTVTHMEHHMSKRTQMSQKAMRSAASRSESSFVSSVQSIVVEALMSANFRKFVKENVHVLRERQKNGMEATSASMPRLNVLPMGQQASVLSKYRNFCGSGGGKGKGSKNRCVSLIVEPRVVPTFEYCVRNVMQFLGPSWELEVHHSTGPWGNEWFVKNVLGDTFKSSKNYIPLTHKLKDGDSYNKLLKSKEFWERIVKSGISKVLVFQSDTLLLRAGVEEFLEYDYIGAPWNLNPQSSSNQWIRIAVNHKILSQGCCNGGLSLRDPSTMLKVIKARIPGNRIVGRQEDVFFSGSIEWLINEAHSSQGKGSGGGKGKHGPNKPNTGGGGAENIVGRLEGGGLMLPTRPVAYKFAIEMPCDDDANDMKLRVDFHEVAYRSPLFAPSSPFSSSNSSSSSTLETLKLGVNVNVNVSHDTLLFRPFGVHTPWAYWPAREADILYRWSLGL